MKIKNFHGGSGCGLNVARLLRATWVAGGLHYERL